LTREGSGEHKLVPAKSFLDSISSARWASDHGFVREVPFEIGGQTVGRLIRARAEIQPGLNNLIALSHGQYSARHQTNKDRHHSALRGRLPSQAHSCC
jgi:hypothetical protein